MYDLALPFALGVVSVEAVAGVFLLVSNVLSSRGRRM